MFNEKQEEYSAKQGKNIEVWQSPKYIEAKTKAVELINSKKYDLTEADFWILMNETKSGKMMYSGLIISHNGCLKINDNLDNKFKTSNIVLDKDGYNNSLVYIYCDEDVYEVGEVSAKNCKNDYPYAMALKRCFDRVVLKKSKLAYAGVYSDSEAEEFKGKDDVAISKIDEIKLTALKQLCRNSKLTKSQLLDILDDFGYEGVEEITEADYMPICKEIEKLKGA